MAVPSDHRLALSDWTVKAHPSKPKSAALVIPWGNCGQVKTTVSSEAGWPQALKLLGHVKQTALGMAERAQLQVCHALTVACHSLKALLISNSYLNQSSQKVVPSQSVIEWAQHLLSQEWESRTVELHIAMGRSY